MDKENKEEKVVKETKRAKVYQSYRAMETQSRVTIYPDDPKLSFHVAKEKESTMSSVQYFVLFSLGSFPDFLSGTGQRS